MDQKKILVEGGKAASESTRRTTKLVWPSTKKTSEDNDNEYGTNRSNFAASLVSAIQINAGL